MENLKLADVLAQSPSDYHDWLKSLPDDEVKEEFFDRILKRGLGDAVLITLRQDLGYSILPDQDDELISFVGRDEPRWYARFKAEPISSKSITENILNKTPYSTSILLDACESDNEFRRCIACNCLFHCDLETELHDRSIKALQGLLEDPEVKTAVYATTMLWNLDPDKVSNNSGLVERFLHYLNDSERLSEKPSIQRDSHLEAARCILKFALWHNQNKDFDELLPIRQPKTSVDHIAGADSFSLFYQARGKDVPAVVWVSNPFEAIVCAALIYKFEALALEKKSLFRYILMRPLLDFSDLFRGLFVAIRRERFSDDNDEFWREADFWHRATNSSIETQCGIQLRNFLDSKTVDLNSSNQIRIDYDSNFKNQKLALEKFDKRIRSLLEPCGISKEFEIVPLLQQIVDEFLLGDVITKAIEGSTLPWVRLLNVLKSLGIAVPNGSEELESVIDECYWCFPFDDVCIALENPTQLHFDERNRTHSADGPAIAFGDWLVYAWHGIVVPENAITEPHTITVEQIITETNVEVKRALLEIYGTSRFLADADAMLIHEDEYGKLYRVSTGDDEDPLVMVHVVDATHNEGVERKEYFLRVSPEVQTAKEAVAWTFGLDAEEYAPTKQT